MSYGELDFRSGLRTTGDCALAKFPNNELFEVAYAALQPFDSRPLGDTSVDPNRDDTDTTELPA